MNRVLFGAMAIGAGAVSFLSMFGLLEGLPFLAQNIEELVLLMVAALLGAVTLLHRRLEKVEDHASEASRRSLEDALHRVEATMPAELRQLFKPFLDRWSQRLREAVKHKRVRIEPVDQFPLFYRQTLEAFPRDRFMATSLASKQYFWKNEGAFAAMKAFTEGGGRMSRVFFLDSEASESDAEVLSIIRDQLAAGIRTLTVDSRGLPREWFQLFVVSGTQDLAWIVRTAANGPDIESTEATADEAQIRDFRKTFECLVSHPSAKEWFVEDGGLVSRVPGRTGPV